MNSLEASDWEIVTESLSEGSKNRQQTKQWKIPSIIHEPKRGNAYDGLIEINGHWDIDGKLHGNEVKIRFLEQKRDSQIRHDNVSKC